MKFELNVLPSKLISEGEQGNFVTQMELYIERQEFLSEYEKDDVCFSVTLRQLLYIYHLPYGYIAQITDECIFRIVEILKRRVDAIGILFHIYETEKMFESVKYRYAHSIQLDFGLVKENEKGERIYENDELRSILY